MESTKSEENAINEGELLIETLEISHTINTQLNAENETLIAENLRLKAVVNELFTDLKTTKISIISVMNGLGMMDESGTINQNPNFSKIMGSLIMLFSGKSKISDKFSNLEQLVPLLEKYQNL